MDFLTTHWATVLRNASNNETPDKLAIAIGPSVRYILIIMSTSCYLSFHSRIDETDLEAAKKVFVQNKALGILISRSMKDPKKNPSMKEDIKRKASRTVNEALRY